MREVFAANHRFLDEFGLWLSLVERLVRDQEAVGSNPTSPISRLKFAALRVWIDNCGPEKRIWVL
jgi:hypothetical protein